MTSKLQHRRNKEGSGDEITKDSERPPLPHPAHTKLAGLFTETFNPVRLCQQLATFIHLLCLNEFEK